MKSLILAGGGLKVGYQAGCLQVLLDEAELRFDHVDAASGGSLNGAMLFSGLSGREIADNWRQMNPYDMIQFNWKEYYKLFWARSISTLEKMGRVVYPGWRVDFAKIRSCSNPIGTFNIYNFSDKRLEVFSHRDLDEELLNAAIALPMWFPPVERHGKTYLDAVYCTDGNVGEAVRMGADEIWAIWTVADLPDYRDGFLAQYFHIIETVANTRFKQEWEEIQAVNRAIRQFGVDDSRHIPDLQMREGYAAGGWSPPPGRKHVDLHLIKQEVPVHYLLNTSRDRMVQAVEMGVRDAREYCRQQGITLRGDGGAIAAVRPLPANEPTQTEALNPIGLEFTEEMKGYVVLGCADPEEAEKVDRAHRQRVTFRLTMHMDDLDQFIGQPEHHARATGWVDCPMLGGRLSVIDGTFNLFVIEDRGATDDPTIRRMDYRACFLGNDGTTYRLEGSKRAHDDPGLDVWPDLSTLRVRLFREEGDASLQVASGTLKLHFLDFMQQLTTFRVHGAAGPLESIHALTRFGQFFLGSAWDLYARHVLDYSPF